MKHPDVNSHPPEANGSSKERNSILASGVIGTFILLIADLCSQSPTVYKAGNLLTEHTGIGSGTAYVFLMVVLLFIGFAICWVYEPKTKVDAFIRGMSIFAILSLAPPADVKKGQPLDQQAGNETGQAVTWPTRRTDDAFQIYYASFHPQYGPKYRFDGMYAQQGINANATVVYNQWVSKTRPDPSALSFFTNSVSIDKLTINGAPYALPKGTRIEIDQEYLTPLRNYRYLLVKFVAGNQVMQGWIYSGKSPNDYVNVTKDR